MADVIWLAAKPYCTSSRGSAEDRSVDLPIEPSLICRRLLRGSAEILADRGTGRPGRITARLQVIDTTGDNGGRDRHPEQARPEDRPLPGRSSRGARSHA